MDSMAIDENAHPTTWTFPDLRLLPRSLRLEWSYAAAGTRDLRLDLLRGFAVFAMVVDHFGGASWLYLVTGGNTFLVSGAEAFVSISGFVVGLVYGGIALGHGLRAAQVKALRRAFTLYKLTVVLSLLFASVSLLFKLPWINDLRASNPLAFFTDVVLLRQTLYLTDVMLMYTLLMLAVAGVLWLLTTGRTRWLLAASSALWLAFQFFPDQLQVPWKIADNTTFNLAAWQLLFFVAMVLGYHRNALAAKIQWMRRVPYWFFSGLLLVWLVEFHSTNGALLGQILPSVNLPGRMNELFLKSAVAPGRLFASLVVFQFGYLTATMFWKPIHAVLGWFLLPLGQNALYVYTVHVAAIALYRVALGCWLPKTQPAELNTTGLQLLVLLVIWAMIQRRMLFNIIPR